MFIKCIEWRNSAAVSRSNSTKKAHNLLQNNKTPVDRRYIPSYYTHYYTIQ